MAEILRVYYEDRFVDTDLTNRTEFSLGAGKGVTVLVPSVSKGTVRIRKDKKTGCWNYISQIRLRGEAAKGTLHPGHILAGEGHAFAFLLYETDYNDEKMVSLVYEEELLIGRGADCQIRLDSPNISRKHALLRRTSAGWELLDCSSSGEPYVNGTKTKQAFLKSQDEIDLGLCHMIFLGTQLSLRFPGACSVIQKEAEILRPYREEEGYPFEFRRSPRFLKREETGEIEIEGPPSLGKAPQMKWLSVILPPIVSFGMMALMSAFMGFSPISMMFSLPMTLMGIVMSVINYRSQKKNFRNLSERWDQKYQEYLDGIEGEVLDKQAHQRQILTEPHPSPEECLRMAKHLDRNLWNRGPEDDDFMTLRLGLGSLPSCVSLRIPKEKLSLEKDTFLEQCRKLEEKLRMVPDCPITLDLLRLGSCGFVGQRGDLIRMGQLLILQAAAHHSYADLHIITICRQEEWKEWSFIRWLPHAFNETRTGRRIVIHQEMAQEVLPELVDEIQQRYRELEEQGISGRKESAPMQPYLLFLCADAELASSHGLLNLLGKSCPEAGVGALYLFDRVDRLPKGCASVVELQGNEGIVYSREDAETKQTFLCDRCSPEQLDEFARAMAPIRLDLKKSAQRPVTVTFLEGYGVQRPSQFSVADLWESGRPERSMAVHIGARAGGVPILYYIHDKQNGPLGLVAGTTGSGKSEMVQTWILSMALRFPPQEVSFVLIDFKGTGLILPFKSLPHLAGTISDLDTHIGRNLIALEKELERRKGLFDQYHVQNIRDYYKLYREGKAEEAISYLFVIIDEFAEFKIQFPEFMDVVNRIFATGRTLGVSILLLTQKPSGVVSDKMTANTRFRWCLKVASSYDSMDMLGCKDAARITNSGRAIVQVGENEVFETIQAYWSGAPYRPNRTEKDRSAGEAACVDIQGKRHGYAAERTTGYRAEKNEIDAVVEYLDSYVRDHGLLRARNIWTQKMETEICLNEILTIAFDGERWKEAEAGLSTVAGMVDDPRAQTQYPLLLDMERGGSLAIYGSVGSGKTTLLQTAILSFALSYSPEDLWMYIMDFGGGNLLLYKDLPHMGDVALADDGERMEKMADFLLEEMERRKRQFSALGAMNLSVYRELSGQRMPYILLILDNFAPVLSLYPKLEGFFHTMVRESAAYGIYMILTANNQAALSYRLSQNFLSALALQMNDASDYGAIVGRTGGLVPEAAPGRGLMRSTPPLEFQAALPMDGSGEAEKIQRLRQLVTLMKIKWTGSRPQKMAVMPEFVTPFEVAGEDIGLGLSYGSIQRAVLDPRKSPAFVISEKRTRNRYFLLKHVLLQIERPERILLYDVGGSLGEFSREGLLRVEKAEAFEQAVESLMEVIESRGSGRDREAGFPMVVLAIADYRSCMEQISQETRERLKLLFTQGRNRDLFVAAAETADDIQELVRTDRFLDTLVKSGTGVLIGGSGRDHRSFQTNLSYMEMDKVLHPQDAYFCKDGETSRIKYVQEEGAN